MVAHALAHDSGAGVAHAKALAGQAVDEALAARGTVEGHVANGDVLVELVRGAGCGGNREDAAREALAKVVVGVADHVDGDAGRQEGAKALAAGANAVDGDGVLGESLRVRTRDLGAEHGAHAAVHVGDVGVEVHRGERAARGLGVGHKERGVQRARELVCRAHLGQEVTGGGTGNALAKLVGHACEDGREVDGVGLPVARDLHLAQALGMADHLLDRAEAQLGHDVAQLLCHQIHEVDHVLGLAVEALAQLAVLRGDTHGAGVRLAVALHEAAKREQRGSAKVKDLGAEKRGHGHVATVHELAVCLQLHARAQAVLEQRLLGLGKAKLQRQARVVDGVARCGTSAAVGARDQDLVRATLGNARGNGAHTRLGDQLHRDRGLGVGVLEVKDELGQVLDGVDVVVRRGRDKAHARCGVTHLGDPRPDLCAGQVPALAGLGALGHLDLDLLAGDQVAARHAKARRGNLLDLGVCGVAVGKRGLAVGVLATLARVGLGPNAVHGNRERTVCLVRDGAKAHGACLEALHDGVSALDLVQGHGP